MFNQHFGQYLLNEKKITSQQLLEVMEYERSARIKLGILAINSGFMTALQVETVHQLQRVKDKRFGELAVEHDYLTYAQLEDLLENQHSRHLGLSQVIVDKGYLSLAQLEEVLISYKGATQQTKEEIDSMDCDATPGNLLNFSSEGAHDDIYQDYLALLQRNIVRFLDVAPLIGQNESISHISSQWLIYQEITGEINLFTGLAMNGDTLLEIARKYSGEVLIEIDELAKDSVAEFLNMVNGIFCVNASNKGMELDLQLQTIAHDQMPILGKAYGIPITLTLGKMDVIIAVKE